MGCLCNPCSGRVRSLCAHFDAFRTGESRVVSSNCCARECLCCNASCRLQAAMVLTLACNVDQGGDSGELMAAGCQLAVGHPPGYPLYVAIAHAVVHLLPAIGSPAYKLNLVASGACVCALTRAPA